MNAKLNIKQENERDSYAFYLEVRTSLFHFGRFPQALESDEDRRKLAEEVIKQESINDAVQRSSEYAMMVVPDSEVDESLSEIYGQLRQHMGDGFQLEEIGFTDKQLRDAVLVDLRVAAVLNYIAEQELMLTDMDAELFFRMHPERFITPEKRQARQILITINEEYKENRRKVAEKRISDIYSELQSDPDQFEVLARKHSECPTAMDGGVMGTVTPGQLYPELDQLLFSMEEGEIGPVTESELGFHILCCDAVIPEVTVRFDDVREKIKTALRKRNQRIAQRKWLTEHMKNGKSN